MPSTVLPPTSQHEFYDGTPAREPVLREGAVPASSPPALNQSSSSELGLPGTFPRDPHVPLDRLSEKATTNTEETDTSTLLGAAREDVRRAVDAAAQYLPEGVIGAIGSVLAVGTGDTAEAEKKRDSAQTSQSSPSGRTSTTFSGFDPSKVGVAGIATDLNLPSKSRETPASTTAARRASEPSDTAAKPAFVSYLPSPVITGSTPPPERSETPSTTQQQEDYAPFVAYAPGPVITDAPPSDDDVTNQKDTESHAERRRPGEESASTKDASKKNGAAEAAAVGAGVGTLGGAGYKRSPPADKAEGTAKQPTSQETAKTSGYVGAFPKPSGAPAPAPVSKEPVRGGTEAQRLAETDASNDSTKKREAVQAAALGAGIGTLGGAAYKYSRSSSRAPEQTTSDEASGLGANVKASSNAPVPTSASKGLQDQTHPISPSTDEKKPMTQNEKAALMAGAAVPATVPAEKEAKKEPSAFADDKQAAPPTDKDKGKDTPPVLAPVASADEKSDKEAKKETKRLEEERKKAEKKAEKERQEKEKEVAAAEAAQKRSQKEAKEQEKEMKKEAKTREKEEKKMQKEAEKEEKEREKVMKRQEKEAAAVVAVGGGIGAKEVEDAKRGEVQPEEKAEKKEGADDGKKVTSTRTKDEAAAAAAATLAAASAEREHKRKASVDSPPQPTASQADSNLATNHPSVQRRPGAIDDKAVGAGEVPGNKQVKGPTNDESRGWQKDESNTNEAKTKTKDAAATTAAVCGTAAAIALAVYSAKQEKKQKPSIDDNRASQVATSAHEGGSKPTRPGPSALTDENSPAKSGADSDFPLPSEGTISAPVRAVDISGKGPSATPALGTGIAKTTSAPAAVFEQTAPPPERGRVRYHGTEGLQEKYEGGALKSSFIGRRSSEVDRKDELQGSELDKSGKDDKENGEGKKEKTRDEKDSGSGKKEGIVKHIVEKVKDKLHHH